MSPPNWSTTKASITKMHPNMTTIIFIQNDAFASDIGFLHKGLIKSIRMTPVMEFRPVDIVLTENTNKVLIDLDCRLNSFSHESEELSIFNCYHIYLSAALNTPETNIPGKPGTWLVIFITK